MSSHSNKPPSPEVARPSRRELLTRVGGAGVVLAGAALLARGTWDQGGLGVATGQGARQVRDYRLADASRNLANFELAVARGVRDGDGKAPSAEDLVTRALAA